MKALKIEKIRRLTQVYVTLSLGDLAELAQVHVSDVERIVVHMIQHSIIRAKIHSVEGIVHFQEKEKKEEEGGALLANLNAKMHELVTFSSHVRDIDTGVSTDGQYLSRVSTTLGTPVNTTSTATGPPHHPPHLSSRHPL